jgi:CBS domain-containing protein
MEEVARFLARHPPFDRLPGPLLARTAAQVEIEFFPRGTRILGRGGPGRFLHLVVKGTVELRQAGHGGTSQTVETLTAGEAFGPAGPPASEGQWEAVARTDVLAYLLPGEQLDRLRSEAGFQGLLAAQAGDRLRHAMTSPAAEARLDLLSVRGADLVTRPLVTVAPGASVAEAARRMRNQQVSSLLVDTRPPGLVTSTDLRNRVLAAGRSPDSPVRQVMTTPLHTMPADSSLGELLLTMVERGIHHLPLTRGGRVVAMVTDTDLLRHESRHPLLVRRQLDRATGPEGLAAYAAEVTAAATRLVAAGTPAGDVTRFISGAHDALYVRAVRDAEAALGPPPCPYALLVLGSGARWESTLQTDQDHALVLADDPPPTAGAWFAALAERLAATLEDCGLPRCPGQVMATNPARRVPLAVWQDQFSRWIEQPDEEALRGAAVYLDFRQLCGELDAETPLRRVVSRAAGSGAFLGRLAAAALRRRPPLGFLHQLRGEHRDRIDLKIEGTAPIVDLARLLALEARRPETTTVARLQAAVASGTGGSAAADLVAAFAYLQELRLRHQADQVAAGAAPDNTVALGELSALQRRWLKDAAHVVQTCQQSVRIRFRTDQID